MNINFFERKKINRLGKIYLLILLSLLFYLLYTNRTIKKLKIELEELSFELESSYSKDKLNKVNDFKNYNEEITEELNYLKDIIKNDDIDERVNKFELVNMIKNKIILDIKIKDITNYDNKYIINGFSYSYNDILLYKELIKSEIKEESVIVDSIEDKNDNYEFTLIIAGE